MLRIKQICKILVYQEVVLKSNYTEILRNIFSFLRKGDASPGDSLFISVRWKKLRYQKRWCGAEGDIKLNTQ